MINIRMSNLNKKYFDVIIIKLNDIKLKYFNDIIINFISCYRDNEYNIYFQMSPRLWNKCHKSFVRKVDSHDYTNNIEEIGDNNLIDFEISLRGQMKYEYRIDRHYYDYNKKEKTYVMKKDFINALNGMLYCLCLRNEYDVHNPDEYKEKQLLYSIHKSNNVFNPKDSLILDYFMETFDNDIYNVLWENTTPPFDIQRLSKINRRFLSVDDIDRMIDTAVNSSNLKIREIEYERDEAISEKKSWRFKAIIFAVLFIVILLAWAFIEFMCSGGFSL